MDCSLWYAHPEYLISAFSSAKGSSTRQLRSTRRTRSQRAEYLFAANNRVFLSGEQYPTLSQRPSSASISSLFRLNLKWICHTNDVAGRRGEFARRWSKTIVGLRWAGFDRAANGKASAVAHSTPARLIFKGTLEEGYRSSLEIHLRDTLSGPCPYSARDMAVKWWRLPWVTRSCNLVSCCMRLNRDVDASPLELFAFFFKKRTGSLRRNAQTLRTDIPCIQLTEKDLILCGYFVLGRPTAYPCTQRRCQNESSPKSTAFL